jgi:hypothetical protein
MFFSSPFVGMFLTCYKNHFVWLDREIPSGRWGVFTKMTSSNQKRKKRERERDESVGLGVCECGCGGGGGATSSHMARAPRVPRCEGVAHCPHRHSLLVHFLLFPLLAHAQVLPLFLSLSLFLFFSLSFFLSLSLYSIPIPRSSSMVGSAWRIRS